MIGEYEDGTIHLPLEWKTILLNRSSPQGFYRSFYENELKPMVKANKPWDDITKKIIDRFSLQGDRNRHIVRLKELTFDPNWNKALQEFVDDVIYTYKRAYPRETDPDACVLFIKSYIPANLQSALSNNLAYIEARDIESLKKAVKHDDLGKITGQTDREDRQIRNEIASMLKELSVTFRKELESIRKDNESNKKDNANTRNAVMAAFRSFEQPNNFNRQRPHSPQSGRFKDRRSPSPHPQRLPPRSPSPPRFGPITGRYEPSSNRSYEEKGELERGQPLKQQKGGGAYAPKCEIFNSTSYFERFGRPPSACSECNENSFHWARHCYKHLN